MSNEGTVAWDFLQENLNNQIALYSRLIDLLKQENETLINKQHQKLIEISDKKEQLIPEISDSQKKLTVILKNILVSEPNQATLLKVLEYAPAHYKSKYIELRKIINEQKKEIMLVKYRNQKLMENAVKYVQHMMSRVMDLSVDNQQVYSRNGDTNALSNDRSWMDIVA